MNLVSARTRIRFTADQLAFHTKHRPNYRKQVIYFAIIQASWLALLIWAFFYEFEDETLATRVRNVAEWSIWLFVARSIILRYIGPIGLFGYVAYLTSEFKDQTGDIDVDQKMFGLLKLGLGPGVMRPSWIICMTMEVMGYLTLAASGHFKSATFLVFGQVLSEVIHWDAGDKIAKWLVNLSPQTLIQLDGGLQHVERGILTEIGEHCSSVLGLEISFAHRQLDLCILDAPQSKLSVAILDDKLVLAEARYRTTEPVAIWALAEPTCIDELYERLAGLIQARSQEAADRHIR